MTRCNRLAALAALALSMGLIAACSHRPTAAALEPSRTETILAAQYASKDPTPPMTAIEGEAIAKNYIASIGKPLDHSKDQDTTN